MIQYQDTKMQNSTLSGAFDTLRRKRLRSKNPRQKLEEIKKKVEQKNRLEKTKQSSKKLTNKTKLANLRFAIELRKKMDAVKQNIRKTD